MDTSSCQPLFPTNLDVLPRYRHATPSGPWPWMDFDTPDNTRTATTGDRVGQSYPQNLFPNWTPDQVKRSQMLKWCSNDQSSMYWMDVLDNGKFTTPQAGPTTVDPEKYFSNMIPGECLVHSCKIEPFFFTSSINWIPSRYQEELIHGKGDHITITLPFVRKAPQGSESRSSTSPTQLDPATSQPSRLNPINNGISAPLHNGNMLCMDLLAIHMVRDVKRSIIISYHPQSTGCRTSAKHLHSLIRLVGDSVYWQNIFSKSKDPTFLFLAILWYALYAWDESLESLYNHVSSMVPKILDPPAAYACPLYTLQALLLHYESLLHDYQISVSFIEKTPNPAMHCEGIYEEQRKASNELMKKECGNLLSEIDRLEKRRMMLHDRLKNLLDIVDSRQTKTLIEGTTKDSEALGKIEHLTKKLTEATVTSSAALTQIEYLTKKSTEATIRNSYLMIFLLASFIASVFWMNVKDINGSDSVQTLTPIALTSLRSLYRHQTDHTSEVASGGNVVDHFPLEG
ncbi:hypothetical protein AZE42_07558 [Rhizopogon vesiculosus]|uniref:Uncharacterized protein n=1 Tax=Rhizopogon vesiculosus TaxID=180088 RepID=A0A1J8QTG3_9AGAM|nr:hypothetical protein AZE42_07558 [Rhizopogon vesiculosus]